MKIEILGTGCTKCNMLEAAAKSAADRLGISYELQHVKDINEIMTRGVMLTPALAIDGQVRMSGRVPAAAEIEKILGDAANPAE